MSQSCDIAFLSPDDGCIVAGMLHRSPYDMGVTIGIEIGRTKERSRIKAIMALPEAEELTVDAAALALDTQMPVPDAQKILAQLGEPPRKARAAR